MKLSKFPQTFFTSDLHFGHKPVIGFCNRPFTDLQAMEDGIVANWNKVVRGNDRVIIIGDVFFCGSTKAKQIMDRLNGVKILVKGNHDGSDINAYNCGFSFVCEKMVLKIADQEVMLSHYPYKYNPIRMWFRKYILRKKDPRYMDRRPKNNGGWLLHGHTHDTEKLNGNMIHVGCDAWDYAPVPLSKIESIIKTGKL